MSSIRIACFWALIAVMTSCSSQQSSGVLEEVPKDAGESAVSESNPEMEKLNKLLKELGYKGVGLQYEETAMIERLHDVFSDARTHHRKVQLIYTGLEMDYDERYESLTVGGEDAAPMIQFIEKKVPKRGKAK